jgi:hypothetical protein
VRRLILRLIGSKKVRKVIKTLRLHSLGNWWLHRFPVVKTLPGTAIRYRARRVESLALAAEMFESGTLYGSKDLPANIRTFADIGCNVGYFTCWLCQQLGSTQFLRAANMRSTAVPSATALSEANTRTRIEVPCVEVEESWRKQFGDEPCDLLKVDIEGSGRRFFRRETDFLKRVRAIVVEWHKWRVSLSEIEGCLSGQSFFVKSILCDQPQYGIAVFSRKAP